MIYRVAEGHCFGNKDKTWKEGDVITRDAFNPKEAFDEFVKRGEIVGETPATSKSEYKPEEMKENKNDKGKK